MLTIERISETPYRWQIGTAPLDKVANVEKGIPAEFISEDGMHITDACRNYLLPLIQGEDYPPFKNGVPDYVTLKNQLVAKLITAYEKV
jgi:ATP-dependent phosphofructokinase / diphosphate-dependent phosphofructokinase